MDKKNFYKAEWVNPEGTFDISVRIYAKRSSFLAAWRKIAKEGEYSTQTRGVAHTDFYLRVLPGKEDVRAVKSIILMDADWCTPGIFAHEANHVAHHWALWMKKRGISQEELRCQYLDTIIDLFDPLLRKRRKYVSRTGNWHPRLMW